MVNAGRILIMPRGDWDNLVTYNMLDLVTGSNYIAYIARQASVGVDPTTDSTQTYWQPFGTTLSPDGDTIVDDGSGVISVNIDAKTIIYDSVEDAVKVNVDGSTIVYDSNSDYLKVVTATLNNLGVLKPDGSTITISNGTISAAAQSFAGLSDTTITSPSNGQVPIYNGTTSKWENGAVPTVQIDDSTTSLTKVWSSSKTDTELSGKASTTYVDNTYKVTSKTVATTGWTSDTTSQSGTTLYKKTIALSHVYVTSPSVDIGASGVLPTTAQQEAYNLLQYVTINGTTLTLYASAIPSTSFYINIEGVD